MSLELKNVSCIYEKGTAMEVKALNNVNLTFRENEIIGIIGCTGSGKSTLIQLLNGLIKPTDGIVLYNGENIWEKKYNKQELNWEVGLVFQYPEYQLFENTVIEDVSFGPKNMGCTNEEARTRAENALTLLDIFKDYYNKSPFQLSGGEKRRIAIAGVLAMTPQYIVLDEPTASLDPKTRNKLMETLYKIYTKENKTIIIVSHSMEEVAQYVNRIIVLNKGEIFMDDTKENVFKKYKELESIGLAAPNILYLMNMIKEKGVNIKPDILSIEEAVKELVKGIS